MNIYGIPNCNSVKKALSWFTDHQLSFTFHDYKKQPPTAEQLKKWMQEVGSERLINRKGTTWRTLTAEEQAQANTEKGAIHLMMAKPSVIKRPLIESTKGIILGFDEPEYQSAFSNK